MDDKVIQMVKDYYKNDLTIEQHGIPAKDVEVYIVWKCKTLQNCKYIMGANVHDSRIFEITYNGNKDEFYFDAYVKEINKCIKSN